MYDFSDVLTATVTIGQAALGWVAADTLIGGAIVVGLVSVVGFSILRGLVQLGGGGRRRRRR